MNYPNVIKTILAIFFFSFSISLSTAQIFVDQKAGGNNDGSSWEAAYSDLQDAIDSASENDQVWVATGTYFPGKAGDPKSTTFHVTKGIQIYGGFEGTETQLSERNPSKYPTILSGDLNQDDIPDDFEINRDDNVQTVMLVESRSQVVPIIDGFTFQGGHADEKIQYNKESQGGGLFLYSPAIINNCSFSQNYSGLRGGALYFIDSIEVEEALLIDSCLFQNNYSKYGGAVNIRLINNRLSMAKVIRSNFTDNACSTYGGGMVLFTASDHSIMEVDSCNFSQNSSEKSYGSIYGLSFGKASSLVVKNSKFEKNQANISGGAICLVARKSSVNNKLSIEKCTFESNSTLNPTGVWGGGAAYVLPGGTNTLASIHHSVFKENSSNGWAGAMAIVTGSDGVDNRIEIDSCQFKNNRSDCGGAILYMSKGSDDSLLISQSQFIGNSIEGVSPGFAARGGAIYLAYVPVGKKAYSRIEDCWFENNTNIVSDGGAIFIEPARRGCFSSIYNSTFKGNQSMGKGGAFAYGGADHAYELEACIFEDNRATKGDAHIYEKPHFDNSLFYIIFHGVLWVQILYSLFLFLISRERTTLYYTLFMIGLSLFFLALSDAFNLFFHIDIPVSRIMLRRASVFFSIVGLVKFAQHYLNVNHFIPRFKIALNYYIILFFISHFVSYFLIENPLRPFNLKWGLAALSTLSNLLTFIGAILPVVWAIIVLRKGYKPAKYFLLAMLFAGLATAITIASVIQFGHVINFPFITIQSLILLTIIALGLADGYRVNLLKKDKARAEQLAELDIAKTRLYTNITHEFRTPLTVIMGASDQVKGNEQERDLIKRNSKQLLALINQMLDLSKLEGGALKLEPQQGDIIPFIEYLVESFQSLADSKYIKLTFYRELEELNMDYDAEKVQAVITNLLSNAIKFTAESGKVVVHAKEEVFKGKPQLTLIVRDNGSGIPAADIPHVFDRFFQVDATDMRRSEGSGIGLALVKELIQLMKGQIEVTSKVDSGTVFTIRIPITNDAPFQTDIVPTVGFQPDFESLIEEKDSPLFQPLADDVPMVLIIEDNKDVVRFLRSCLQKKYKIEVAYNGQQGIDKALDTVPDIIISDVMMPEADGYTVCKTLKADERTSHVPIVMLTAKATQDDKVLGLDAGADAYLNKPFHRQELEVRLQKLIEGRQQLQQHYQSMLNSPPGSVKVEDPFIQKLKTVVEENIEEEKFGINELCKAVNLSRMQVHRKLKALIGIPATQFIHSIRLQKAYQLLQDTDLNVSEVAYKVGFSDHSYFTRLFVKQFGKTPSAVGK